MSRSDAPPATRSVPFARELARHGDRLALVTAEQRLSYRELAARVDAVARQLGTQRRLVLLAGANRIDSIVVYLAALAAGHPLLLVPGDNPGAMASLLAAYRPDVVASGGDGSLRLVEHRAVSAHELHPDLALLMSTSGSTGSPKLVRLSHDSLQANAESISAYLDIRDTDRAATTLPMHYCYGLSVINSHLLRGAAVILTELSVADSCFWELFAEQSGTSFAGVPYTFDLLDRAGFAGMSLPSLRYVTQAGGRLAPDRVRSYAELGQRGGWDLFVMYGQTEATARMAYLPPELALNRPQAVGIAVPGGDLRLEPLSDAADLGVAGRDVGELVYRGRNVMLGYAHGPADLGLGRTVTELRTGDIARRGDDGLYEVIGRRSRFIKVFGLRIDLQRVETLLQRQGTVACCAGTDDRLVVAVEGDGAGTTEVRHLVAGECGLPHRTVLVHAVPVLPRLASGKPDYSAVLALAGQEQDEPSGYDAGARVDVRAIFAELLGHADVTEDSTFVSLGGDSLSYVEMSIRLEQVIGGRLPSDWPATSIRHLQAAASTQERTQNLPDRSWRSTWRSLRAGRRLDTSIALRAIAIVLIVGSHIQVFDVAGGAHVLIGVAGYNFARFHLTSAERRERVRHLARSIARIMLAATSWIAAMYVLTNDYSLASVFLANYLTGADGDPAFYGWHFWFVEALVYFLLILLAAVSVPVVDRLERRHPFALPLALAALALVSRYQLVPGVRLSTPVVVFWLFALGWATAKASTVWQRLVVTIAVLATVPGFFGDAARESVVVIGLVVLVWVVDLPSLGLLNRVAASLAASSIYIYLTHWQIFRPIDDHSRLLALLASLAFGVAYAMVVPRAAGKSAVRLRRWAASRMRGRLDRAAEGALN